MQHFKHLHCVLAYHTLACNMAVTVSPVTIQFMNCAHLWSTVDSSNISYINLSLVFRNRHSAPSWYYQRMKNMHRIVMTVGQPPSLLNHICTRENLPRMDLREDIMVNVRVCQLSFGVCNKNITKSYKILAP